ncbi:MAG: 50S ribosomal protein L27 [Patescibacteria group bacterium]|nr:50S ribosomal protein L27 [Patescibacteria group bacterium]
MAHKKAGGSTHLGRDSQSKRLGVKLYDGEWANAGSILVRQRGTTVHPGKNVKRTGDDTLIALRAGKVKFSARKKSRFNGALKLTRFISVIPEKA